MARGNLSYNFNGAVMSSESIFDYPTAEWLRVESTVFYGLIKRL